MIRIILIDMKEREEFASQELYNDIQTLTSRRKNGELSATDQAEFDRLSALSGAITAQPSSNYLDPLFATARAAFGDGSKGLLPIRLEFKDGTLQGVGFETATGDIGRQTAWKQLARVAYVLGLLQLRNAPLPLLVVKSPNTIVPDAEHQNMPLFDEAFYSAVGRAGGNIELAANVLLAMAIAVGGDLVEVVAAGAEEKRAKVSTLEFAKVLEKLIEQGVKATDPNLKLRVEAQLDKVQEIGEDKAPLHEISINLPDLEATTDYQVVADNIRLMGPMIFASMFDELKAFQVVDKLVEMSQRGELSLTRGKAGTRLYNYWREAPNRMNEIERQTFYAMTLGVPTGQPGVAVNKDFQDLWVRFVSSVSTLVRENRVDQLLRSALPAAINQQHVKKAARDLASNMSLFGYGMAYYAAIDLQTQINEMIDLLQDPDLRSTFGARDMWGVIDQVAQVELGGARNSSKYRTLATCGAIITGWLANNLDRMRDPTRPMIDLREIENPPPRPSGQTATSHPTDYDLVNACELWLADSAMAEDRVEEMAQPRESPQQPSRPIQIPSIARDLLEGTGLGMEMGAGGRPPGRGNGRARTPYQGY